jgi:hypothetical protein
VVARRPPDLLEVVVLARDSAPVKTSLNWTMPLFVKSSVWSPPGTRLALWTIVWPRSAK